MRRINKILFLIAFMSLSGISSSKALLKEKKRHFFYSKISSLKDNELNKRVELLYKKTNLDDYIGIDILHQAMLGYEKIGTKKKPYLVIIDFNKSSKLERFFVINVESQKVLYQTLVAHGKNSGEEYANSFSNEEGSLKSSLGFFVTGEAIISPKHGYAMLLNGVEDGINDNARERQIIMHSADYVSKDYIRKNGRLGRSWGCPALPKELNKEIIDLIKGGSVLFIAHDNSNYKTKSRLIK